jgi:zinc protease
VSYVRTFVDGVPVLWAKSDGPLRAGLVFRVGRADETLARGGITHLVEHLALHRVGQTDHHSNGETTTITTSFYTQGTPGQVTEFMASVSAALHRLPLDRIPAEVNILRTEARTRSTAPNDLLLLWRYGPAAYGLPAYDEYGLNEPAALDVQGWARDWFTRGNAVLWVSGEALPDGLRLDLPDGPRLPPPFPSQVLPRFPAYFNAPFNGVMFDAHVPRSAASALLAAVLERRMYAVLRVERGLTYTASTNYDSLIPDLGTLTAFADALPERRAELVGPFVDILLDLAASGVTDAELATVRSLAEASLNQSDAAARMVPDAAHDLLVGAEARTPEQILAELRKVTPYDLHAVAEHAMSTALVMVPEGSGIGRGGFVPAPTDSDSQVRGVEYTGPPVSQGTRARLIVGPDGVTVVREPRCMTVRYADCAGMLAYPDGGRLLFAPDAVVVPIEPRAYGLPPSVVSGVDAAIPKEKVVRMPPRAEDEIPERPADQAEPPPERPRARRSLSQAQAVAIAVACIVVLVLLRAVLG